LIEEFFKNQYSADQRYVIMNALALAARELASLPVPESSRPLAISQAHFASKTLPAPLHQRYIQDQATITVENLSAALSRAAIQSTQESNADKVPELVRERRLRIRPSSKIGEVTTSKGPAAAAFSRAPPATPNIFSEVAAEFFIMPLINRFWLFLRDEQTREARTAHHEALHRYRGAGTGLILNALILAQLLRTLSILVHASQNALEWLAIIAPEALELAVTIGTRPISLVENQRDDDESAKGKDASILTASLELALVILDGSLDRDGGRSLSLEHTMLLLGAKEWAETIFEQLEKGVRVEGGGGMEEVGLKRAAAGVILKLEEIISKWRQSMIDMR
jgi:telomere length regulation protein